MTEGWFNCASRIDGDAGVAAKSEAARVKVHVPHQLPIGQSHNNRSSSHALRCFLVEGKLQTRMCEWMRGDEHDGHDHVARQVPGHPHGRAHLSPFPRGVGKSLSGVCGVSPLQQL